MASSSQIGYVATLTSRPPFSPLRRVSGEKPPWIGSTLPLGSRRNSDSVRASQLKGSSSTDAVSHCLIASSAFLSRMWAEAPFVDFLNVVANREEPSAQKPNGISNVVSS